MSKNILIFRLGQLGDTLVCIPVFQAVRRQFPDAHIAMLIDYHPDKKYVTPAEFLPPGIIDEYIPYMAGTKNIVKLSKKILELRQRKFDSLIYLPPKQRSSFQIRRDLVFFKLAGIKNFIGSFNQANLPPISKTPKPLPNQEHELDYIISSLKSSGILANVSEDRPIDIEITQEEDTYARNLLTAKLGNTWQQKLLIAVCPGAKWPSKIWSQQQYIDLLNKLQQTYSNINFLLFGAASEQSLCDTIKNNVPETINLAGTLEIRQSAAIMAYCKMYVGNDTGAMHLAVSAGIPCVTAFSAQDWPGRWYPYGNNHKVIRKSVACEGCMQVECPREQHECMQQITVNEMYSACKEIINR